MSFVLKNAPVKKKNPNSTYLNIDFWLSGEITLVFTYSMIPLYAVIRKITTSAQRISCIYVRHLNSYSLFLNRNISIKGINDRKEKDMLLVDWYMNLIILGFN